MKPTLIPAAACLLIVAMTQQSRADLKVTAVRIVESRSADLVEKKKDASGMSFSGFGSGAAVLTITIEVQGPEAEAATHYGHMKIKAAKTDAGGTLESLRPRSFGFEDLRTDFAKIDRNMMFMGRADETAKDLLKFELRFELPPRGALELKVVEGSLKLRTGSRKDVLIGDLAGKIGKVIEDKDLAAAGLKVKIVDPKGKTMFGDSDPSKTVAVEMSGKLGVLLDIELVDEAGKSLSSGSMSSGGGKKKTYTLYGEETLPKTVRLKLSVAVDQKDIDVPFKLTGIKLP